MITILITKEGMINNMKNQKGMGHITLIICIIAIIVIATLTVKYILNEKDKREIENLSTDMLLVQGKIKVISQENEMSEEENPLVGKKVQDNLENEKIKVLIDNNIISKEDENFEDYYIIDSETLVNDLKLEDNLQDEYYVVNYKTYEVIFSKGIEIEEQMYYTLTDILEHKEQVNG
jgi:hypothetical protein